MKKEHVNSSRLAPEEEGFNPCSNGMKKEPQDWWKGNEADCFNPCSNGMKKELFSNEGWLKVFVLILVLME